MFLFLENVNQSLTEFYTLLYYPIESEQSLNTARNQLEQIDLMKIMMKAIV